jgi:hypothetical protein
MMGAAEVTITNHAPGEGAYNSGSSNKRPIQDIMNSATYDHAVDSAKVI